MGDEEATKPSYKSLNPWTSNKEKGGFRAASFVYVLMKFENMGFVANMVSLVLYFYLDMHFDLPGSANTLTNFMGTTFLLSIVGAFISDTYMNRFNTCLVFATLEIVALVMMTIQAHDPSLLPSACPKSTCVKGSKALMFYTSLCFLALGSGGLRGALPPLGADQFNGKDPREAKDLASYFNYLLLSITLGAAVGVTFIVWVSTNKGWWWGFLICTIVTSIGLIFLVLGKPFYRLQAPVQSPILRITQVIIVSFKNRKLSLPEKPDELYEISEKESSISELEEKISHTKQFRCLDKAAILGPEAQPNSHSVCTVTQVEEVKVLTRMMPIIASTVILNTCMAQLQTFSVQQGNLMDRYLGSFQVPASSIPVIPLIFMSVLLPIYEFIFVPFARKITHHPSGISQLQRVGVGLVLSSVSMVVAALVEVKRRNQSIKNPSKPISLFWISFQYGIFGIADMFTLVGLLEFFYKEAPQCMRSLSTSFTWISLSLGYFVSTVFIDIINSVTKRLTHSKHGWLYGQDLDQSNLDLFYWFLAIVSVLNFMNYLYWASWYKYKTKEPNVNELTSSVSGMVPFLKEESTVDDMSSATNGAQSGEQRVETKGGEK